MKMTRVAFIISLILLLVLGFHLEGKCQPKGSAPVIDFAWAQEKIRQREDWRIYISATDPDGNMSRISCRVDQVGGGDYRPDITNVKKGMEGKLTGYLVLRTNSPQDLYGVSLTLTLIIADRGGNESKPVFFPLTINGERMKPPPPDRTPPDLAKELNQRLGYIGIDLMRRSGMGGGGD
jgi:hypothetical protein